jgi:hypothetical protein
MKDGHGNRIPPENEALAGQGILSSETGQNARASELVTKIALAHGVGVGGVDVALRALRHGQGTMAQFTHPDFGGMAQWSAGGMSMVGDMFNATMKARLDGVLRDLADALRRGDLAWGEQTEVHDGNAAGFTDWPEDFGPAAATGSQNDMRYAFFPSVSRLAIDDAGKRTIYDTGRHMITGVSQQQSSGRTLAFRSQLGPVSLSDLSVVFFA